MIKIINADLNDKHHQDVIFYLLNVYITDRMGGGKPLINSLKDELIGGLKNTPNTSVFLAMDKYQIIGMSISFITFSTFTLKKLMNIHDIIVLPEFRNKGVGKKMMAYIEKAAKKSGCGKITLEVRFDNMSARHLYKSLEFIESDPPMLFWHKFI
jgi:ribosomal protein S18 acetylase RimI-like enzyme